MLDDIPKPLQTGIIKLPAETPLKLLGFSPTSGGCINHGGRLHTNNGDFFIKWNNALKFPGMFQAETKGLQLLRDAGVIDIPEVIGYGQGGEDQFLLLGFVEQARPSKRFWHDLGIQLAALHRQEAPTFGLDHDNYIGSLKQLNGQHQSWTKFFVEQRLNVQLKHAIDSGRVDTSWMKKFEALYHALPSLLPEEKPSLLHGDLWRGNVISNVLGDPCLIDPAVYYGSRECDLAMTQLFGGFEEAFYTSYNESFPLQSGYAERVELYNLYPLLVHLNLFGNAYAGSILSVLRPFA